PWASVEELDEEKLEEALAVNLKACFWLAQAVAPAMRANGFGRILVTSSVSARVTMAGGAHYSAAKAGVNAFIRGAAFEFARDGITVNGVEPGFIAKPGRGTMSQPKVADRLGQFIPMGRLGEA
ncbi:SDR family oxidoreductase, partial [bacterium M00.F.Ca.ET.228.01.1.1]